MPITPASTKAPRATIAIINTSVETIQLLEEVLDEEGFDVVTAYVVDFKHNHLSIADFFHTHRPQAVLYDIAVPYVENWGFFREHMLAACGLAEDRFVLTTTNKHVLEELVGPTRTIELIGRPFDLNAIVAAVRRICDA